MKGLRLRNVWLALLLSVFVALPSFAVEGSPPRSGDTITTGLTACSALLGYCEITTTVMRYDGTNWHIVSQSTTRIPFRPKTQEP